MVISLAAKGLAYSPVIRKAIYSTNAIKSLHARFRRSVRARGQFPNKQAAVTCLYLTIRSLALRGHERARRITRWKPALSAFAVTFEDRIERPPISTRDDSSYTVDLTDPASLVGVVLRQWRVRRAASIAIARSTSDP